MQLDVAFAKPIGPYKSLMNYVPRRYCHVELSFHTTTDAFRRQLVQYMEGSYSPREVQILYNRIKSYNGKLIVCFYINWGEQVSARYLSELIDDPYLRPPEKPVYETIPLTVTLEQQDKLVAFYLKNLGKSYDYSRAILSMCPITLRNNNPERFYCSQLVLYSLKAMGLDLKNVNIDHVSPLDVYKLLQSNEPCNKSTL